MLWWLYNWSSRHEELLDARLSSLIKAVIAFCVQCRYHRHMRRIRKARKVRKLRVLFVLGDDCKWKAQTTYEAMLSSKTYDPYVVATVMDLGWIPDSIQASRLENLRNYLARKNVRVFTGCAADGVHTYSLRQFSPDIVIYLQPWGIARNQHPIEVSKYALTCYLPYGIWSYGDSWEMYYMPFIKFVHLYFIEHEAWKRYYESGSSRFRQGARLFATGNPYCELVVKDADKISCDGSVIYAPHWSYGFPGANGTFDRTGQFMLEIAKRHPEIKWVFKPHPMLKIKAVEGGLMSEHEVNQYYRDWERIGIACYDSDYFELFHRSRVLITDCQTFLTEYLLTGKPIIRLQPEGPEPMLPPAKRLFDAFYNVQTNDEFIEVFRKVVCEGVDALQRERSSVRHDLGYDDISASKKIMRCLNRIAEASLA